MSNGYLIGLDFGSESARGVLLEEGTGRVIGSLTYAYKHCVLTESLPGGEALPKGWALQVAPDYTEAALHILKGLGNARRILSIGLGFTASSPLPCKADGTPLSQLFPNRRHAYVKLWKHQSAQTWADRINAAGGEFLEHFGGRVSGEWLLAKAAQIAEEDPEIWSETDRFIEAGDWLTWQLTGQEARSQSFAAYKAQFQRKIGYPEVVPGLRDKLSEPIDVGAPVGELGAKWLELTGIQGTPVVAAAIIDSHVAMPALGVVESGSLMGALGTSAVFLLLEKEKKALPRGIEGMAYGAAIPGVWCYEAGQASFGDLLAWFVRSFPRSENPGESFVYYNNAAAQLKPGENHLVALDWWNGCRVPFGDSALNGMLVGMNMRTTAVDIYRALLESICFGARTIIDALASTGSDIAQVVLTGGLSQKNDVLMQMMSDVLGRTISVPMMPHPTAIGAAIHGAVGAGVVRNFAEGTTLYGAKEFRKFNPNSVIAPAYETQYSRYATLSANASLRDVMHALST